MLLFSSKIPFGHDKAWSAEPFSVAQSEFRSFDEYLYDKTALKFKWAGFKVCSNSYALTDTNPNSGAVTTVATWPYQGLTIPDWLLAALLALPTVRSFGVVWVRRRRMRRGLCIACGYDLRGASGRCPECGRIPHLSRFSDLRGRSSLPHVAGLRRSAPGSPSAARHPAP